MGRNVRRMMPWVLPAWFAAAALSPLAAAQEAPGGRMMSRSEVVPAPAATIWNDFTHGEGIARAWGVAKADVEFRVGGLMRTSYDPDAVLGDESTIGNTILSFEPGRMVSIRPIAPAGAPEEVKLACTSAWTVVRLDPIAPDRTRVTVSMMGFGEGPGWDEAYRFFEQGNRWSLERMAKTYAPPEAANANEQVLALLDRLVGGDWVAETVTPDGKPMLVRTRWEKGLAGSFHVAHGWIGGEEGMWEHGLMVAGVDPATGGVAFWSFGDARDVSRGHVRLAAPARLTLDWNWDAPGAPTQEAVVEMEFTGGDAYHELIYMSAADALAGANSVGDLSFRRVTEVPERFTRMRKAGAEG